VRVGNGGTLPDPEWTRIYGQHAVVFQIITTRRLGVTMADDPIPFEDTIDLCGDENLQLVIRAHLYAEQLLFAMLTAGLKNPSAIDLDRLTFPTKARLAVAMGLMTQEVLPPLNGLNTLRNSFAHKADYKFTDKDKLDLLNTMPSYVVKVMLANEYGKSIHTREDVPLERILVVLVCLMEARRQDVVESKQAEQEAITRLREVLDKGKPGRTSP
jgi:hypothetical protein